MKVKALLAALFLTAANFAWAQGGLGTDNVKQHMDASKWVKTNADRSQLVTQGPIDKFNVVMFERDRILVDTNKFKQSYDGQS